MSDERRQAAESGFPHSLLRQLLRQAPWQPATQLWRALEVQALLVHASGRLRAARQMLDLGCGDGGIMILIRSQLDASCLITGIDIDDREIATAALRGVYADIKAASSTQLPFSDAAFDCVFSNSVLEHIEPIDATLREASRVLASGGSFVATVPGPGFHAALAGPWLPWATRETYLRDLDRRLAHWRYWNEEEWRSRLEGAGIHLTAAIPYLPAAAVRRWENISRVTGGLLYTLHGGRTAPIDLQRRMGMRQETTSMPESAAAILEKMLSYRLDPDGAPPHGCLLLIGLKR
jgi:ubiquinone/menaquinone biosynthesis C-methylase UbiE